MIGGVPGVWAEDEWCGPVFLRGVQWDHCVQWSGLDAVFCAGVWRCCAGERLAGLSASRVKPSCSGGTSFASMALE